MATSREQLDNHNFDVAPWRADHQFGPQTRLTSEACFELND
jgi:hypothetical protein